MVPEPLTPGRRNNEDPSAHRSRYCTRWRPRGDVEADHVLHQAGPAVADREDREEQAKGRHRLAHELARAAARVCEHHTRQRDERPRGAEPLGEDAARDGGRSA